MIAALLTPVCEFVQVRTTIILPAGILSIEFTAADSKTRGHVTN